MSNRAAVSINIDYTLYCFAVFLICGKVKGNCNAFNYEYLTLGFYLPDRVGVEAILVEGNLTRCQRAPKGTEQSPASGRNQVIQGGGVWFLLVRGDTVVLGYLTVNPEEHRLLLTGNLRSPDLPFHRLYLYP